MKQSKIKIISKHIKNIQPNINITKISKKKDNYIIKGTIPYKQIKIVQYDNHIEEDNIIKHNITELKTYIIPKKDIILSENKPTPPADRIIKEGKRTSSS